MELDKAASFFKKGLISVGAAVTELPNKLRQPQQDQPPPSAASTAMLEEINRNIVEEQDRNAVVRDSKHASRREILGHLEEFLERMHPMIPSYEEWISQLHPENVVNPGNARVIEIDNRFYHPNSDHRRVWNENLGEGERKYVDPK